MSLPKRYLHRKIDFHDDHVRDDIIAICMGLGVAISFYMWMSVMQESLRLQSVNDYNEIIVLSRQEVNFFSFFYAFIALLAGQATGFIYIANKAQVRKTFPIRRTASVKNDSSNLLMVFLLWFLGTVFGLSTFFIMTFKGSFPLDIYHNYKVYFILFMVVLFLHQWLTIRRIFMNRSLKWMLASAFVVCGLSFALSRISVVDHEAINRTVSQRCIYSHIDIELPVIPNYYEIDQGYPNYFDIGNIYFAKPSATNPGVPEIIVLDKLAGIPYSFTVTDIDGLAMEVESVDIQKYDYLSSMDVWKAIWGLKADRDTPMKYIKEVKKILGQASASLMTYSVLPPSMQYTERAYEDRSPLTSFIGLYYSDRKLYESLVDGMDEYSVYRISIPAGTGIIYSVNGIEYDTNGLCEVIRDAINDEQYLLVFDIDDRTAYYRYIDLLANTRYVIEQHRQEYIRLQSPRAPGQNPNDLYREATSIYPMRIFDLID